MFSVSKYLSISQIFFFIHFKFDSSEAVLYDFGPFTFIETCFIMQH